MNCLLNSTRHRNGKIQLFEKCFLSKREELKDFPSQKLLMIKIGRAKAQRFPKVFI